MQNEITVTVDLETMQAWRDALESGEPEAIATVRVCLDMVINRGIEIAAEQPAHGNVH